MTIEVKQTKRHLGFDQKSLDAKLAQEVYLECTIHMKIEKVI